MPINWSKLQSALSGDIRAKVDRPAPQPRKTRHKTGANRTTDTATEEGLKVPDKEAQRLRREDRHMKELAEKQQRQIAEASNAHLNFGRFIRTLNHIVDDVEMERLGNTDVDIIELVDELNLAKLPMDVRHLALVVFMAWLRKVQKRAGYDEFDDPLPVAMGGWDSDRDLVKLALDVW